MDKPILEMDSWTKEERSKYCPHNHCKDDCCFKKELDRCAIEEILRTEHRVNWQVFGNDLMGGKR